MVLEVATEVADTESGARDGTARPSPLGGQEDFWGACTLFVRGT